MSVTDQASNDLKLARNEVHNLDETFNQLQSKSLSILEMGDQWKELQNSFGNVQDLLENRVKEVEAKSRDIDATNAELQRMKEEAEVKKSKLDSELMSLSERIRNVEIREKQVKDWFEKLQFEKRGIVNRGKEIEARDEWFKKSFERVKAVDAEEKKVEEWWKVMEERERGVLERLNTIEKREEVCAVRENQIILRHQSWCSRENKLKTKVQEIELRDNVASEELRKLNEFNRGLRVKEAEMNRKEIEFKEKASELELKQKMLELKEKEVKEKQKELELKSKRFEQIGEGSEPSVVENFCKNMDAFGLRTHLLRHCLENRLYELDEPLRKGLRSAPDAAKLVLYVCQTFDREYIEKNVTLASKNSCIYLLEHLVELSKPIALDAREEALFFASCLRLRLGPVDAASCAEDNHMYLQFLDAYKLGSCFSPHELMSRFAAFYSGPDVYRPEQQVYLSDELELSRLIPGLFFYIDHL